MCSPGQSAMRQARWFLHPIVFSFSIVAVGLSLILYIHWYLEVSTGLKKVIERAGLDQDQILAPQTWVVILVLSILVGIILMGIFTSLSTTRRPFSSTASSATSSAISPTN
jgi:two-component system, OmpR family, phosphate regulon sensor histidine kinase PhoR